jgi:tRNA A-37 threonylcarbamoyl transferase component Bud32
LNVASGLMSVDGNEMLLGRIALASGMVTRQQLEECIAVSNSGDTASLMQLLVQKQYLTEEQLQIVIGIHGGPPPTVGTSGQVAKPFGPAAADGGTKGKGSNEPTDIVGPAPQGSSQAAVAQAPSDNVLPPVKPDAPMMTMFGRIIVEKGWATSEQVETCLKHQKELSSQGQVKQLGEIMLERGMLTLDQIQQLLSAQNKVILACGGCGTRYNAANVQPGKVVKCVKCGEMLKVPERIESAGTEATVFGDAPSRTSDALIGKEIGGCRVLERLGRGGMATVYKAKHIGLNKMMAIKILPPTAAQSRDTLERFLREARAAAKLEHPNVVQVYNVGRELGYTFILMQYIEGLTLAEKIEELGYLPEQECTHIVKDVTRAFVFAHKNGIVHRDVKPDNIMMTSKGEIKVMDFGIAQDVQLKQEGKMQLRATCLRSNGRAARRTCVRTSTRSG